MTTHAIQSNQFCFSWNLSVWLLIKWKLKMFQSVPQASVQKRGWKTPCLNQGGRNRAVKGDMELSGWRAPNQGEGINKGDTSKPFGVGWADWQKSPSPPVRQTPLQVQPVQNIRGDKKHPNQTYKPTWVREHTTRKTHAVWRTPPPSHIGWSEVHTRPL